jgi:hypothetical protein
MKQKIIFKSLLLIAAAALGLPAFADDSPLPAPAVSTTGLLGQHYAGLTYRYINPDNSPSHTDDYRIEFNEPLNTGLDGVLSYDFLQTGAPAKQQEIAGALRAFSPAYGWGKPYVEAGGGYAWNRVGGMKDNSFLWEVAAGAEFLVGPAITVTPFVQYKGTPDLARRSLWDFGVKANYWVTSQWAITGGLDRDDHQDTGFTVGTNFRF